MREIGIHFHDIVKTVGQGVAEPGHIGRAEPQLSGALDEVHPGLGGHDLLDVFGGAVWGVVVDHQDFQIGMLCQHLIQHPADVFDLVVGGDDDYRFHHFLSRLFFIS